MPFFVKYLHTFCATTGFDVEHVFLHASRVTTARLSEPTPATNTSVHVALFAASRCCVSERCRTTSSAWTGSTAAKTFTQGAGGGVGLSGLAGTMAVASASSEASSPELLKSQSRSCIGANTPKLEPRWLRTIHMFALCICGTQTMDASCSGLSFLARCTCVMKKLDPTV